MTANAARALLALLSGGLCLTTAQVLPALAAAGIGVVLAAVCIGSRTSGDRWSRTVCAPCRSPSVRTSSLRSAGT